MLFAPITTKTKEMKNWKNTKFLYGVYRLVEKPSNLFGYIVESKDLTYFWACGQEKWLMPHELVTIGKFIQAGEDYKVKKEKK